MSTGLDKVDLTATDAVPVEAVPADEAQAVKARGYWELVFIRFRRDKLAVASVFFIVFLILAAFVGGPVFSRILGHGPNHIYAFGVDQTTLAPVGPWSHISTADYPGETNAVYASVHHGQHLGTTLLPLGGDGALGHDLFLRLLYGAQTSLEVAVFAMLGSVGLGIIMGLLAGYFRGWVDTVISRLIEIVMVFPFLLFIIALDVVAGPQLNAVTFGVLAHGVFTLALIFSVFGWFYPARIIRGVVLSLREKEFVEAARMTGASDFRIMRSHLLPHLVAPIIVYATLIIASNIIAEAGLSFLGLGIQLPTASWGNLLEQAPQYYLTQPWLMVWPGLCILLTTLAFNLFGDGLRDAFDPRARI
ncbi:MAG TPA: ABC transporter permease [Gaiellaceae bacterium]|nr:ABC transporter permease [Gaiellaceae bacterium]